MDSHHTMTYRERFLAAAHCQLVDRTPVWLMRQAGRSLPEYLKLKKQYSFLELAQTPELAVEVTLQPIRRFDYDAAILFSDILVIPEAMGQPYSFREQGGIAMDYSVRSRTDIDRLTSEAVTERLHYVKSTLEILRKELGDQRALLGFAGSPWTLGTYMVEGGSSRDYRLVLDLYRNSRGDFEALMEKVTDALISYFKMQIHAGVDAVQIFDSWGGVLKGKDYLEGSLKWIRKIIEAIRDQIPVILFAKGCAEHMPDLCETGAQIIGLDWTVDIGDMAQQIPSHIAIQGNLDPLVLNGTPAITREETQKILDAMRDRPGHIFNLGHGIDKDAKLENVQALLDTIRKPS
ncbi:MAG: uroporphyrinogen decarboxylase [Verrucomicrobia bacterium]|nr:uroporphyrinogen decarboxylase [Verrucomicrobiota bacterium]